MIFSVTPSNYQDTDSTFKFDPSKGLFFGEVFEYDVFLSQTDIGKLMESVQEMCLALVTAKDTQPTKIYRKSDKFGLGEVGVYVGATYHPGSSGAYSVKPYPIVYICFSYWDIDEYDSFEEADENADLSTNSDCDFDILDAIKLYSFWENYKRRSYD